jgi:hypothetical protein
MMLDDLDERLYQVLAVIILGSLFFMSYYITQYYGLDVLAWTVGFFTFVGWPISLATERLCDRFI